MKIHCEHCGEPHDLSEIQVAFDRPDPLLAVPPPQRRERWWLTADLAILDGERFFIRGLLEIPVAGEPRPYAWGVWAMVAEEHFRRHQTLWDAPEADDEPPFPGRTANQLHAYPQTLGLPVTVRLRSGPGRPTFTVDDPDHPLAREQREGVHLERVLEFSAPLLHRRHIPPPGTPRRATLEDERWTLVDVAECYRSRRRLDWTPLRGPLGLYWLPDAGRVRALEPGQYAKLVFRILAANERGEPDTHLEPLWVGIDHRRDEDGVPRFSGVIFDIGYNPGLAEHGTRVWFGPEHVLEFLTERDAPPASAEAAIHCGRHSVSHPAYVCAHLATGTGYGFYPSGPAAPRPDARCEACEEARRRGGDVELTAVCGGCYDELEAARAAP